MDRQWLEEDMREAKAALRYFDTLPPADSDEVLERRKDAMSDIKERIKELQEQLDDGI